jgi:hypothetical protein
MSLFRPNNSASFSIEPQGVDVSSVSDFIKAVFDLRNTQAVNNRKFLYRGMAKSSYQLLPTIGRPGKYALETKCYSRDDERNLLHRFRRRAYPHTDRVITAGEAIFLARHHKLPTRLLDWTANALYALYFASSEDWECTGQVWAMLPRPDAQTHYIDPFELAKCSDERSLFKRLDNPKQFKIVNPFYNSPRILAQDGVFTIHSDPWKPLECFSGKSFEKKNLDVERLYLWLIPSGSKVQILKELSGLGITHRMVYPDLDGIARSLWETEVLWNREKA